MGDRHSFSSRTAAEHAVCFQRFRIHNVGESVCGEIRVEEDEEEVKVKVETTKQLHFG